jgi:Cu(I)/Ag(I) efflux system membrane protein CusA/SilA
MLDKIISFSIENRLLIVLMAIILLATGIYFAFQIPVDILPDLTAPVVVLITEAEGWAPREIETQITYPIESVLNGLTKLRRLRSRTLVGKSMIWVEFDWDVDIYLARQLVAEKLNLIADKLPPGIDLPQMAPISSVMGEVYFIGLTSESVSPMDMRTFVDWHIIPRLLAIAGVAQVSPYGGEVKQYQVIVSPQRLIQYDIGLNELLEVLKGSNNNSAAGFYWDQEQEFLVRGLGRFYRTQEIDELLVKLKDNVPIRIKDLGTAAVAPGIKRGTGSIDNNPGIVLTIKKQPRVNTVDLTRTIDTALDDMEEKLPEGITLHRDLLRQADFIETAIANLFAALRDGALLVILVLMLFLLNARTTFISITAIPTSMILTIFLMRIFNISINTMTLGGIAIAIGALVDDAIIDVENVLRRLKLNQDLPKQKQTQPDKVVFFASKEIRSSIIFATFIEIIVFIPLFFLGGIEGRIFKPLGFSYVTTIFMSLVIALTLTPALCSLLLSKKKHKRSETRFATYIKAFYKKALERLLDKRKLIIGASAIILLFAISLLFFMGRTFLPPYNEGSITVEISTLPGTNLDETDRISRHIEGIIMQIPEVISIACRTGSSEGDEHSLEINSSEMDVKYRLLKRKKNELLRDLRGRLSQVEGISVAISGPISHRIDVLLSGAKTNLVIKIFGDNLMELRRLAYELRELIEDVPGIADLSVELQMDIPYLNVKFDYAKLAKYGISFEEASAFLETANYGSKISQIIEGDSRFDFVLKFDPEYYTDLDKIKSLKIKTAPGYVVSLEELAYISKDKGPNRISRENVKRKIEVQANISDRDIGSVVKDVKERVKKGIALPPEYYITYGGQFESEQAVSRILFFFSILAVILIFFLLFTVFRSYRTALIIMVNLPLALIGGILSIFITNRVISVASLVGFVTLFGIATRNGIMMVTHIKHLLKEESKTLREIIIQGALERMNPILMTALTTGLGLLPLAIRGGRMGNEIQSPLAVVVLGGLLSSTVLNMFVVPTLLYKFYQNKANVLKAMQE